MTDIMNNVHVITDKCHGERYSLCAEVCPVDCIHPGNYKGKEMMVIDPEVCIDCGVCLPECPVGSIVGSQKENEEWAAINAELATTFKGNPLVAARSATSAPKKASNKLI